MDNVYHSFVRQLEQGHQRIGAADLGGDKPPVVGDHPGVTSHRALAVRGLARAVTLGVILVVAGYFRFVGLNWDEGHHLHPDERFLSQVQNALRPVSSIGEYLDTTHSSLNPNNKGFGFFVYGDFPVILIQYLGSWFGQPDNPLGQKMFGIKLSRAYHAAYLIGRGLSAVCDLVSVLLVFLIGRQLYGAWVGTFAAALYSATVLPIQQSHFSTVDSCANLFVTAAFWFAARAIDRARWSDDVLFGVSIGLGMASKMSVAPAALLMGVAVALRVRAARPFAKRSHNSLRLGVWRWPMPRASLIRGIMSLNVAAAVAILIFRLAQPYAFLPAHAASPVPAQTDIVGRLLTDLIDIIAPKINPAWVGQLRELHRAMSGDSDQPPNHQWANRTALIFPWINMVRFGMGWPLGLAAWFGCLWASWQVASCSRGARRHVLPLTWVLPFFIWQGTRWTKCMRYLFPIYPVLVVMAAWAAGSMVQRARAARMTDSAPSWRGSFLATVFPVLVLIGTYAWAFAFTRIYTRPHPRVAASAWIYEHIPSDVTLALLTPEGSYAQQIGLPNNWTRPDAKPDDPVAPPVSSTFLEAGRQHTFRFVLPRAGTLIGLTLPHVLDPIRDGSVRSLRVVIATSAKEILTDQTLTTAFVGDATRGSSHDLQVAPVEMEAHHPYYLVLTPMQGALIFSGSTIATEGSWDDALPLPMPGVNPYGVQYHNYALQMSWDDTPQKRARLAYILEHVDYIVLSSNRFYDALSRNPRRWPMTLDYYRALFSGQLGFELVRTFASEPNFGPFEIDDRWAEESFTVYDHPRVFVFRKTPGFSPLKTMAVLGRADLKDVVRQRADQVTDAPVILALPAA